MINIFAELYNRTNPDRQITQIKSLPENDQDFVAKINDKETLLQLTGLTTHEYYIKITKEQYDSGKWTNLALKQGETIPHAIETEKMTCALRKLIQKKIDKKYSKGKLDIWLVIFTTDPGYITEYIQNKERRESDALRIAREYVIKLEQSPFSEIWFTNLQTNPIKV